MKIKLKSLFPADYRTTGTLKKATDATGVASYGTGTALINIYYQVKSGNFTADGELRTYSDEDCWIPFSSLGTIRIEENDILNIVIDGQTVQFKVGIISEKLKSGFEDHYHLKIYKENT